MSERAILERFDLVVENPENIPLLRRYIVDLAMRGKLLEKTDLDISASEMLKRIGVKADFLVKEGKLKKKKPLTPITSDEIPVTYAAHCTFERLGNIANLQKGLTGIQSSIPGELPLVVTAAARSTCDHYDFDGAAAIVPMVSSTGHGNASLNRLHYQEGKFALGTILCAVFPIDEELISARFLFEYLTAFKDELLVSQMNGTANVTLTVGKIAAVPVPIIAPAVQRRVDELMALCDQLEAANNEREARRDRLVAASLHRIGTAPAAADPAATAATSATPLRDAARFHLDHLPRLTTRPEHIKRLRQSICNLAVSGRLVPQDPNDKPAVELLKQIQDWRNEAIEQKQISAPKKILKPVGVCEIPYHLPTGWEWARLGEIIYIRSGDGLTAANMKDGVIPVFGGNGINGHHNTHNIDEPTIVIGRVGYYCGSIHLTPSKAWVTDNAFITLYCQKAIYQGFLLLLLKGTDLKESEKATAQPVISGSKIYPLVVGLPPLTEQHRIVARVDELMTLCDQLEAQLTATQTHSRRLLEAVLHDALAATA